MSPSLSIPSGPQCFQRQIEAFNAEQQARWELNQRKRRRRHRAHPDAARLALLDALDDWRERTRLRWFGPVRWIPTRSSHS